MKQQNEITRELDEMGSILATMPRVMPYTVPDRYFAGLGTAIRKQMSYETDPVMNLPKQTPFAAPEGYFDSFPSEMLRMAQAADDQGFPAMKMPMEAPTGYFEQLPGQILAAVKQKTNPTPANTPTKVIPLKRVLSRRPLRYAAAAMLVIAAGLGLYRLTMTHPEPVMKQQLAQIPEEDLRSYVLYHIDEFETEDLLPAVQLTSIDKESLNPASRLSDENIIQYLDETGWGTEL